MNQAAPPRRPQGAIAFACLGLALLMVPAATAGPEVTVLLHHPNDGVDPFGVPYGPAGDYFSTRYGALVSAKQRFDFPFFVADGVLPLEQIPDPRVPYESSRAAYEAATQQRLLEAPPAILRLATTTTGPSAVVAIQVEPLGTLGGEDLHLMLAITEDPVRFLPPTGLTNGIEDHRFTVRAVVDLGSLDLTATVDTTHSFALREAWSRDRLMVAAWLQQDAPSPRFDAREVVQATHVALGNNVVQDTKGVLLEMLSATWCDPCLYGDLAIEAVAVAHGAAEPLNVDVGPRYFQPPNHPLLALLASVAVGLAVVWWSGRR